MQHQPLVGVPLSSQSVLASAKVESPRAKTALIIVISVLVTSAVFMSAILGVMRHAQPSIQQAQGVLLHVENIMDYPSRLLHGNVFHATTNLLQTDWLALSRNVTKFSSAVSSIFNQFDAWSDFNVVAQYAALVSSVSAKVGWIKPNWDPAPIPRPSDDEGVINAISYVTEFAGSQADRKDISDLASACDAMTANILTVDWSGRYSWGKGRGYGQWDVNSWKQTVTTVQNWCQQFAKIPKTVPSGEVAADDTTTSPEPTPTAPIADDVAK